MFKPALTWITGHRRWTALGASSTIVAGLVVVATIWGLRMADRAELLSNNLRSDGLLAEGAVANASKDTYASITASLRDSKKSASELEGDLWPLRAVGSVVGWVPILGDNVTGVPDLVERLNHDLDAAIGLLAVAEELLTVFDDLSDDRGLVDILGVLPPESEIDRLALLIAEAAEALARAERKAAEIDDGRLWGKVGRESAELRSREAGLRDAIDWTAFTAESLRQLSLLGDVSLPLVGLLGGGDPAGSSLDRDILGVMPDLEMASASAYRAVVAANRAVPSGVIGSPIGDSLLEFEPVLLALADMAGAGALSWTAISPALDKMESSPGGLLGEGSTLLSALELLREARPQLEEARRTLEAVARGLRTAHLKTPVAASSAFSLAERSAELALAIGFLSDFSEIGPQALGEDRPRRYLVLGQTSDELRGSGGFVSGAWLLTFDDGQMSEHVYHDVVEVDDTARLSQYPLPPELLARHMDAPVWLLRDATWSPEFPSAAKTAAEIFQLGQGGPDVDGVIALTQWAFIDLGETLGSINIDGEPIAAGDLLSALESGTDRDGRAFLDTLFGAVLDEFNQPGVNDPLFAVAEAASRILNRKDMLVMMVDPELQAVVARSGWDGSLGRPQGDRIAVIDSNVGWTKVDRNIERSFVYDVTLHLVEPVDAHLTLFYRNLSDPASRGCESQAPIHGLSYVELKQSCYWNLVRVYVPDGGSLIAGDLLPIPEQSVYARLGVGVAGDDSVDVGIGPGGKFISGLMTVRPGETTSTGFDLTVPASALTVTGDTATYRLDLTAQSGARGRNALIRLGLPEGYEYHSSSLVPSSIDRETVEFAFLLLSDVTLEVQMRRGSADARSAGGPGTQEQYGVAYR